LVLHSCTQFLADKCRTQASTTSLAAKQAAHTPIYHKALKTQGLEEEAAPEESGSESSIPDPEEAKKKAAEAFSKATGAAGQAFSEAEEAVEDLLPESFDVERALVSCLLCLPPCRCMV
jgi:hypothetical protein